MDEKQLRDEVKRLENRLKSCKIEEIEQVAKEYTQAKTNLETYLEEQIPPEAKEAQSDYDMAKVAYEKMKVKYQNALANLILVHPNSPSLKRKSSEQSNHTSGKLSYDDCQEIRRLFSEGKTAKELATQFNVTSAVIMYKVYYLQSKLRKGDKAYTPLINKYYPEKYLDNTGKERSGAPYVEDNMKEDNTRYKKGYNTL